MKAAVIEEYGSIVLRDLPDPEPGEYEVVCELLYGTTCSGTDIHLIEGHAPFCTFVHLPFILGHESVGRVVGLGPKVRNYRIGDLVTRVGAPAGNGVNAGWGGFADRGIARDHWAMAADGLPESEWTGFRVNQVLPADVALRDAPMFTTWRETLSALRRMGFTSGASLLVVGSGGNGLSFACHANLLGATEVAMVGSAAMEAAAREHVGVGTYVDYRAEDVAAPLKQACSHGFDFIIDAVGKADTADRVLPCLKPGGRYLSYGVDDHGAIRINPACAPGPVTLMPCSYDESETHQQVSELYLQGKLHAATWYDPEQTYPLDRIGHAFADVKARKTVKALIELSS